jgi:hypothetical protein
MALERKARGALASSLLGYEVVQIDNKDYEGGYK